MENSSTLVNIHQPEIIIYYYIYTFYAACIKKDT